MKACGVCSPGCNKGSQVKPDISRWQPPPESLRLAPDDLHLWRFRIGISAEAATVLRQSLTAGEIARADRFIRIQHQVKFVAARYGLRRILAGYLKCSPAAIRFDYSQQGKPSLGKDHQSSITFNLSHAGGWAVIAVTSGSDVGVDVEEVMIKDNLQQLGDYAFDEAEKRLFADFSPARRQRGFYRLWTAKESRLKMIGVGLGDMKKIIVPRFQCFFVPAKGYVAAAAADDHIVRVVRYHDVITD